MSVRQAVRQEVDKMKPRNALKIMCRRCTNYEVCQGT